MQCAHKARHLPWILTFYGALATLAGSKSERLAIQTEYPGKKQMGDTFSNHFQRRFNVEKLFEWHTETVDYSASLHAGHCHGNIDFEPAEHTGVTVSSPAGSQLY
jgi:hypothetical protein